MKLRIRNETPSDVEAIRDLTARAFESVEHSDQSEPAIIDRLRGAGQLSISLVAESEQQTLGHVAVSPVSISDGSQGWYGLGPISVAPESQGQGVGSALMHQALSALRERGASGCVLLGDPNYYGRFGFQSTSALEFPGVPPEYFQLIAFHQEIPVGVVSYHAAFAGQ